MEAVSSATTELDLGALLPDFSTFMGWVELFFRLCVMVGPLILLGFGLVYLLAPPKEANFGVGYRFWWGMASLEAWQYTQRIAGVVWSALGAVLTIVMALICTSFRKLEAMDMAWRAVSCILWELGLIAVACIAINIVVMRRFDKDGYLREEAE
jgi:hypothetical protein